MTKTFQEKTAELDQLFSQAITPEERYKVIMSLGKLNTPLSPLQKSEEAKVLGCQSVVYLHTEYREGLVYFSAESEAKISSGLAYILTFVFSGETPEAILKTAPTFLDDLKIPGSLTPNRANGLYSIHLRMKQEALKILTKQF